MSFLRIGDRAAGAIKSGGTTRRAAKMVCLDIDHPDIEEFINWKVLEEQKVAALVAGSRLHNRHLNAIIRACHEGLKRTNPAAPVNGERFDPKENTALRRAIREARKACVPENYILRVIELARQGYKAIPLRGVRHEVGRQGVRHRLGSELQQLGAPDQRLPRGRGGGRRLEHDAPHRRQDSPHASRRAICGSRSASPRGRAPIPGCSSTPRSTNGTPAPRTAGSTPRTPAPSTCSWTTRPATWRRST